MEPVVVYGRGARIGMQVDNLNARTKQPLLFEIRHEHLSDCNNPKRLMHKLSSTLTVRRSFIVNNTGEVPFTVVNMSINGWPCENRGFKIINCLPFRLNPNESYSLELAYTPDFLTSSNEADLQLYMHMNGSSWMYPLMATVPADMMARCHRALPRPPFENLMYYSCVTALVFCLICVLACAYLEGDRAIACAIREHYTASRTVFDLNNLDTSSLSAAGRRSSAGSAVQTPDDQGTSARLITRTRQNREGWDTAAPSGVHIAADASLAVRTFYSFANKAIRAVHFVWRWTLVYRTNEEPQTNNTGNRRRRRAPLPVTVVKDKTETPSANVEKSSPKSVDQPKPASKITLQNNNIRKPASKEKLSSSVSVSPKPTVTSKAEQKMENQRKKSAAEAEKRLARAQLMMDDFSSTSRENKSERPVIDKKTANGKNVNRSDGTSATGTSMAPTTVPQTPAKSKPSRPVVEMPTTPVSQHRPPTIAQPEMSSPMTVSIPPAFHIMRDYGEFEMSPDHNRPVTPTPSLASSFGFGQRLPSSHTDSTATSRDHSVGRLDIPRRRNPSEGELSVASELSNAPDWFDESVISGDVDDDFSAFTAPTDMMTGSGSEFGGEPDEKKRKARRGRRGRRLNGGSSESSQEKKGTVRSAGAEKVMGLADQMRSERRQREEDYRQQQERQRLNTISDWPIPELPPLRSLYETEDHQNVPAMWPPTPVSALPSLAPGTDWMSATAQWSQASTSGTSGTSAAALGSQWGEGYNPLSLGLSLGPSLMHGTLFSGQDFELWSENTTLDTDTSWAHMGEPEEEKH